MLRRLGRSGIAVSALGLGTARVGGLGFSRKGDRETTLVPAAVEDSKRAIRAAVDRLLAGEVGRNDPCTCGSGKKYKRCCGA